MNKRIIKKVLQKKHEDFLLSIKDEAVKQLVKNNSIITGGSIASMLLGEKPNDYDYYFTDLATVIAVTNYYVKGFIIAHPELKKPVVKVQDERVRIFIKSSGIAGRQDEEGDQPVEDPVEDEKKAKYRPVSLTNNAISLSNSVQLVIRFYGSAEEIHSNYDYIHCTNYWESKTGKLTFHQAALESLLSKHLYYSGSKYPLCSVVRMRKFLKRGWHINAGQILKMCMQISELDLLDVAVLEDQLTGVDTAYFTELINSLKTKQESDPNFRVTTPYIANIVDKLFG